MLQDKKDDIDWEAKEIILNPGITKPGREEFIPLNPTILYGRLTKKLGVAWIHEKTFSDLGSGFVVLQL